MKVKDLKSDPRYKEIVDLCKSHNIPVSDDMAVTDLIEQVNKAKEALAHAVDNIATGANQIRK